MEDGDSYVPELQDPVNVEGQSSRLVVLVLTSTRRSLS